MIIPITLALAWGLGALLAGVLAIKAARGLLSEEPEYFAASLPRFGLKVCRRIARKSLGRARAVPTPLPAALPVIPVPEAASSMPTFEATGAEIGATEKQSEPGFQARIAELDRVTYEMMNASAEHSQALEVFVRRVELQDEYARHLGFDPSEVLLLNGEWLVAIGHMALIDFWVKMVRLGWGRWKHLVLIAPPGGVANQAYLDYWRDSFSAIVTDTDAARALHPFAHAAGHTVSTVISLPGGSRDHLIYAGGKVQAAWEDESRAPLLRLKESDRERGHVRLREMGVPLGAWYVCVHARSSGYYEAWRAHHQSHRDADIESYRDAIEEITNRGGWVIRLGDASMKPLAPQPRVIDYAVGPYKSDWMDVFLLASCRFHIGGTSGLSHVPATFGVPTAFVNWICPILPFYSRRDRFIPKLLWSDREQRLLKFSELFAAETRTASHARPFLDRIGLREVDNTPAEVRALICEMLDLTEGQSIYHADDEQRQAAFEALATGDGSRAMRVGKEFLRTHQALLSDTNLGLRLAG